MPKKKQLRVMQVVVDAKGRQLLSNHAERHALFDKLVAAAVSPKQRCDVLLLPAGFWPVASRQHVGRLVSKIAAAVAGKDLVVVGGADYADSDKGARPPEGWPFWGFAVGGPRNHRSVWQQKSTKYENATEDNAIDVANRTVDVFGWRVLVILCGEVHGPFNQKRVRIASGAAAGAPAFDVVFNPAHSVAGGRVLRGLRAIANRAQAPGLRVEHRDKKVGAFQRSTRKGDADSTPFTASDVLTFGTPPWAFACRATL